MRILSQDGTIDLPYECIGITIGHRGDNEEFYIFAHLVNSAEPKKEPQKLGTYSTEAKAQKAMEMLREAYNNNEFYHCAAATNTFQEAMGILSIEKFKKLTNEYFRFPQDDEIEV